MEKLPESDFLGSSPDGKSFMIDGVDVWGREWRDTNRKVQVKDPVYHQDFTFRIYEMLDGNKVVLFAAGEFSNCMWGFYRVK